MFNRSKGKMGSEVVQSIQQDAEFNQDMGVREKILFQQVLKVFHWRPVKSCL